MRQASPVIKDLVLAGGGHSHVAVLKAFGMQPLPGARLTLISPDTHTPYSGMLPGLIAGHYGFDDAHIDLAPLTRFAGARFIRDRVTRIDTTERLIHLRERAPLRYDILSLNTGSTPTTGAVPGAAEHCVPVKPIHGFLRHWERLRLRLAQRQGPVQVMVVGAGAGGVELLLAVRHALTSAPDVTEASAIHFTIVTQDETILATHNAAVQTKFTRILADRDVTILTGQRVIRVSAEHVHTADGQTHAYDELLWVTHAAAPDWPAHSAWR